MSPFASLLAAVSLAINVFAQTSQVVVVDPNSFVALPSNATFRPDGLIRSVWNPTNTTPPFFQVFDPEFSTILGDEPYLREVSSFDAYGYAHEAPIYVKKTNEVFFASNAGQTNGTNNDVNKINLTEVELALEGSTGPINIPFTKLNISSEEVQMTNGGTGPVNGALLLANQGRDTRPANLALVNPSPPHNVTVLVNNFYGRQFISLNDVKVHPTSGKLFFTDVPYGYYQDFRPTPTLPNQVYRLDTKTGTVRVVADGFKNPNGIAFSGDGKTAYIADSGVFGPDIDPTRPATVYAFDVHPTSDAFINRRVFAYVDAGIPDGIQVDSKGNVYVGCADGVNVWNEHGTLIGKFFLGSPAINMVFAGDARLVILNERKIFVAKLGSGTKGLKLDVKIDIRS